MFQLPPLPVGGCVADSFTTAELRRLPLSPATALALVENLVAAPGDSTPWEVLLRRDPSLTLWACCRQGKAEPPSLGELARWLVDEGRWEFVWPEENGAVLIPSLAPPEIRSLYLDSRAAAEWVGEGEEFISALLHLAPWWLTGSAPEQPPMGNWWEGLPSWLARECEPLRESPRGAAEWSRQRLRLASDPACEFRWRRLCEELAGEAAAWLAAGPPLAAHTPGLLARLHEAERCRVRFPEELEQAKLASLKELAYGASHEINNPLANIAMRAEALLREEREPARRRMLAAIHRQAFRATEMISDMMLFAKPPKPRPTAFPPGALVREVLAELAEEAEGQGTVLAPAEGVDAHVTITADRAQLAVALRALCRNALEAVACGGRVEVRLARVEDAALGSCLAFAVLDDGPGIAPEVRPHLFDPFFSGREAGRGLGFGLSKCWRIVTEHGGRVSAENLPERGARFTLLLPLALATEHAA